MSTSRTGSSREPPDGGARSAHHRPALLDETMRLLVGGPGLYLDGTVGGGGHAAALLERCPDGRLLGLDVDPEAVAAAGERLAAFAGRFRLVRTSFLALSEPASALAAGEPFAGALLDLGVSSRQLDSDRRGFTFRRGAPLDMRMDPAGDAPTAAAVLASAPASELARVFRAGQAPRPRALAARVAERRARRRLRSSDDLVGVLESALGRRSTHGEKARLFQALRMRVNGELEALARALPAIRDRLAPGAALVVVAYHSVEDRAVKRAFRAWSYPAADLPPKLPAPPAGAAPLGRTLTPKPVRASAAEIRRNPRARPARLRAWRRAA